MVGWIVQCHPTVAESCSVIVTVFPGTRLVLELPSSSVNVCLTESSLVTVSVTVPAFTSTVFGLKANPCAVIVADDAPPKLPVPPVEPVEGTLVAPLLPVELLPEPPLLLLQAAATNARTISAMHAFLDR
jgi:hypothetical protein